MGVVEPLEVVSPSRGAGFVGADVFGRAGVAIRPLGVFGAVAAGVGWEVELAHLVGRQFERNGVVWRVTVTMDEDDDRVL